MSLYFALFTLLTLTILLLYLHLRFKLNLSLIATALLIGLLASLAGDQVKQMGLNFGIINKSDPIFNFIFSLFATGLSAQLIVFLFFKTLIYPNRNFKRPIFGLFYCIWISIGFVLPEFLTMNEKTYPLINILNIFGHISMSMILGYFISMAKFATDPRQNFTYLNSGLGSIILIQGLHEFFILEGQIHNLIVLILGSGFLSLTLTTHLLSKENKAELETTAENLHLNDVD
jgi:RsiW-degrading membrane proteinase PrsW (M82 family)